MLGPLAARSVWLVAAALALGHGARAAVAQPPAPERAPRGRSAVGDKKEALRRLAAGDRKLQRGDRLAARGKIEQAFTFFEAALADYQAAYQAYPDQQIFFPIAQAEQRLGRFVEALQHYQGLLAESRALGAELRNQVQVHLDEVRKSLAAVVLEVEPDGAAIAIDGKEVGHGPMSQPVFVEPGQHSFTVTSDGYETVEGRMDLPPGKETRKRVRLERERVAAGSGQPARAQPRGIEPDGADRPARPSKLTLWVGLGVTGALAVGGTVTGYATLSQHRQYQDESRSAAAREAARRDGRRLAGVTDILFGTALVAGGATAYYYFAVYKPRSAAADRADARGLEEEQSLRLAPLLGPRVAGLAVSGSFW